MPTLDSALDDLVLANRILADQGVLDAFGHVSIRHPERPDRYLMSRSRGPNIIVRDDIIEFGLDSEPIAELNGRRIYAERAIHGQIYQARPDVNAVCHNHAPAIIPFGVTATPLRPILHMGSVIGKDVRVWDMHTEFGDTDMLVRTAAQGASLAKMLGSERVILMRGHGSAVACSTLRDAVFTSVYMQRNAELVLSAHQLGGDIQYLTPGEIDATLVMHANPLSQDRAWESWSSRVVGSIAVGAR